MNDCKLIPLRDADRDSAIHTISAAFSSDDPLAVSQHIDYNRFRKLIDSLYDGFLAAQLSFAAQDIDSGKVAALILVDNELHSDGNEGSDAIADIISCARQHYIEQLDQPIGKTIHIHFVASDSKYRRQRLVSKLTDTCLESARQQGFDRAVVEASGNRSRNLFREHHGFVERVSVAYHDFEWHGKRPFTEIAEHSGLTLMDKVL